jgi:hypothetical protein
MSEVAREVFTEGVGFTPGDAAGRTVITDSVRGRALPDAILAKIDGGVSAEPAKEVPAAEAAKTEPAATATAATPPAEGADPAKPPAAVEPVKESALDPTEHAAARDRLTAMNAKLLADLEAAKAAPTASARSKLEDAAESYIDNHIGALRALIARGLGIDDPDHEDVTVELTALTHDLTSRQFSVPLDAAQQASRDAAKDRQALARDKKSRKAESDAAASKTSASADAELANQHAAFIGNRLSTSDYPFLHAMAQDVDGLPPAHLVLRVIEHGGRTGEIDRPKMSDDALIAYAAKKIEAHYKALAEKIDKARTPSPPSTASPEPAKAPDANTSASQGSPQGHGGRKLTAADSSAAPATPPSAPKQSTRPKSRAEFLRERFGD